MTLSKEYTTDFVISKDGTKIGYRQLGKGSGLILVHGGMMASQNFISLAKLLANKFTVYIPDRRGRCLSGSHDENYGLPAEREDIQALINKTKAQNILDLVQVLLLLLKLPVPTQILKKLHCTNRLSLSKGQTPLLGLINIKPLCLKEILEKRLSVLLKGLTTLLHCLIYSQVLLQFL